MSETYGTADTGALLEAGAILPSGSRTGEDADRLTARRYTHPALDGRAVVRLTPATLGEAEDLALDFLGLHREAVAEDLGQVRRETLGFPAWALVNDPANGHHALALVQDIERLGRLAKSRAGAAKDGFEELGARLGRSVPHFLPTFYEQAARAFLAHENTTYAASLFGKAREAERVHSLPVDEDRRRAVFLEFAFAGALTVKALKDHVRDLARRLAPAAAWEQFRRLVVERCAAGVAPYAALPQDARRLLKAAGPDRTRQERELLAELLRSPAVARAPGSFWTAYRPALTALAQERPEARRRLLEIMPTGLGDGAGAAATWLEILAETGAEELLTDPPAGEPGVVPAAWLTEWSSLLKSHYAGMWRAPATYDLVRRMAPVLRAQGVRVDPYRRGGWRMWADLDLLDVCLAEGVPVADPPDDPDRVVDLHAWFRATPEGRQDLAAVAADTRLRPLLKAAVGGDTPRYGSGGRPAAGIARHPVLAALLAEWLEERAAELARAQGLPGARSAIERMRRFRASAAEVCPAAVERVRGYDAGRALGRTLRAGIFDEVGWPALEEAMRLLGPGERSGRRDWFEAEEAWPALIVARRHKAVVAGPEGILLEHDLRIPDTANLWGSASFRYVDGELLVSWWEGGKERAYWSSRPADVFTLGTKGATHYWRGSTIRASLPLPGGGRTAGGRAFHAGDTRLPEWSELSGDGTAYWRLRTTSAGRKRVEYDPATGAAGRASLPALLAGAVRDGSTLMPQHSQVLPMQPGLEGTLLGTDGALLGRWVRVDGDRVTAGTPDGTEVSLPVRTADGGAPVPLGALRLPGGAAPVLAVDGGGLRLYADGAGSDDGALAAEGSHTAGTPLVPQPPFWHAMRVRDEAGSLALRAVPDERASGLVAAMAAMLARARKQKWDSGRLEEAKQDLIARELPEVTHPGLRRGVAGVVLSAVRVEEAVAGFAAPAEALSRDDARGSTAMFEDYQPEHGEDPEVMGACRTVLGRYFGGWWSTGAWTVLQQIRAVNEVLSGKPASGKPLSDGRQPSGLSGLLPGRPGHPATGAQPPADDGPAALPDGWTTDPLTAPDGRMDWAPLLDHLPELAYRAAAPEAEERSALLLLLDAVAEGPLAERTGGLRRVLLREPHRSYQRGGQVLRQGERTVVILTSHSVDAVRNEMRWVALDHDPAGAFGPVAHFTLGEAEQLGSYPADRLTALTRLVRERGPAPWRPRAAAVLAAAPGCGPAQAALLVAGRPIGDDRHPAGLLELTGLKTTQARRAGARLDALGVGPRLRVVAALLPDDPADLWESGPDAEAAARVWTDAFGDLVRLPDDPEVSFTGVATAHAAEAVLNPARTPWLSRTTVQRLGADGRVGAADPAAVPDGAEFVQGVRALGLLAYELPGGHPLRAALPPALEGLRRRLADPGLLLDLDLSWTEKGASAAPELRRAYGLPPAGGAGADGLTRAGEVFVLAPWYQDTESVMLRPAGLTGPDDPALGLVEGLVGDRARLHLHVLRAVLGDGLERAVGVCAPDGYAQHPGLSTPHVVAEAAAAHGLGEDAAVLYLQLLALPDPTDRNSARWTGWRPARLKRARAELAASGLVVEATRSRAGRGLFLPGGWEALKAPALPVETWKRGHLPVLGGIRTVPTVPVADLFEAAWRRVRGGDAPAFEELTTRATRKGRRG